MTRLTRIQAWACRSPIHIPVETSFGRMKDRPAVFLRIEDDSGAFGWGEIFANWPASGAEHRVNLLAEDIAPMVIGHPLAPPESMFHDLEQRTHIRALQCGEFGPFRQVLAGLDQAMWDMLARRADQPVQQALTGGQAKRVPAYASGIPIAAAPQMIARARTDGFTRFKVKVGFGTSDEIEQVHRVHANLAPNETLMLDANQAWTASQAAQFLDQIADLPIGWLEEPIRADCPDDDWRQLMGRIPLAGGENIAGLTDFDAALALGVLDVYQPDIAKWGGFSGCLAVARRALTQGHIYCPHFLGGGIGLAASAQLLAAAGGPGMLEVDVNPNPLRDAFGPIADQIENGFWKLRDAPGIGINALPDAVLDLVTHYRELTA
ncbi:mandelate racemase/muconate lactonizing enzyme family protein [Paracoccus sp. Z330]|uniref:Mandelate racemase/muconate lactonizing enzyme family protein n=1 Tax=Paracoccus onchidii TaxID=3017813 RepID=A0ABT4ZDH1_9RHOB|nr:mandelate racemase/muconate lactonizing enzyme family protein [Paracoccus onchidii]MDB6177408.1 mandelate racemase/muconate lactonizing enzyme family protein [Paracoccus onchidii]